MRLFFMCAGLLLAVNSYAYEHHYWYESGGYEGRFDGRYRGFGAFGGVLGFQVGAQSSYEDDYFISDGEPTFPYLVEPVAENALVTSPFNIGLLAGYDVTERITPMASLSLLVWERCDVIKDPMGKYCTDNYYDAELVPGLGIVAKMLRANDYHSWHFFSLTTGYHYRWGIGGTISVGFSYSGNTTRPAEMPE